MNDSISDWMVERVAAGDLPPDEAKRVRERLAERNELERLTAIARANEAFLAEHPVERVAAEVRRRAVGARSPRRSPVLAFAVPALALAVLAIWLVKATSDRPARDVEDPEVVRHKGLHPQLVIYKKTARGGVRLVDRARVRAGDTIQLAYIAAAQRFGVIASIDGRGAVTLHLPEQSGQALQLAPSGETALQHAFTLDDSPGFERFVFITADQAFPTSVAADTLRGAPPPNLSIAEITLEKESP